VIAAEGPDARLLDLEDAVVVARAAAPVLEELA
jgi:hypothetical protein